MCTWTSSLLNATVYLACLAFQQTKPFLLSPRKEHRVLKWCVGNMTVLKRERNCTIIIFFYISFHWTLWNPCLYWSGFCEWVPQRWKFATFWRGWNIFKAIFSVCPSKLLVKSPLKACEFGENPLSARWPPQHWYVYLSEQSGRIKVICLKRKVNICLSPRACWLSLWSAPKRSWELSICIFKMLIFFDDSLASLFSFLPK